MYTPPFSIAEDALETLAEICTLLTPSKESEQETLSVSRILQAHAELGGVGSFRSGGTSPHWVPVLVDALAHWVNESPTHPIIRAAVFHFELLRISPFSTANELVAAHLHQRMLAAFHPALASFRIPDETNIALAATDASDFIRASLHAILATLQNKHRQQNISRPARQQSTPANQILSFIRKHPGSKRQDLLAALPAISQRMLDRHLQTLRDSGQIEYRGSRKTGAYYTL